MQAIQICFGSSVVSSSTKALYIRELCRPLSVCQQHLSWPNTAARFQSNSFLDDNIPRRKLGTATKTFSLYISLSNQEGMKTSSRVPRMLSFISPQLELGQVSTLLARTKQEWLLQRHTERLPCHSSSHGVLQLCICNRQCS